MKSFLSLFRLERSARWGWEFLEFSWHNFSFSYCSTPLCPCFPLPIFLVSISFLLFPSFQLYIPISIPLPIPNSSLVTAHIISQTENFHFLLKYVFLIFCEMIFLLNFTLFTNKINFLWFSLFFIQKQRDRDILLYVIPFMPFPFCHQLREMYFHIVSSLCWIIEWNCIRFHLIWFNVQKTIQSVWTIID